MKLFFLFYVAIVFFTSCSEVMEPIIYSQNNVEENIAVESNPIRLFLEEKLKREREFDVTTTSLENIYASIQNLEYYVALALTNDINDLIGELQEQIQKYRTELLNREVELLNNQRLNRISWDYGGIDIKYAKIIDDPTNISLYLEAFLDDGYKSNISNYHPYWNEDLSTISITIDINGTNPPSSGTWEGVGGYAYKCNGSDVIVVLNPQWNNSDEWSVFNSSRNWNLYRIEMIYHEIGHSLFNYDHVFDNDGDGIPDRGHREGEFDIMGYGNAENYQEFIDGIQRFFKPPEQNINECGINGKSIISKKIKCFK